MLVAVVLLSIPPSMPWLTIVRVSDMLQDRQVSWAGKVAGPPLLLLPWLMVVLVRLLMVLLKAMMPPHSPAAPWRASRVVPVMLRVPSRLPRVPRLRPPKVWPGPMVRVEALLTERVGWPSPVGASRPRVMVLALMWMLLPGPVWPARKSALVELPLPLLPSMLPSALEEIWPAALPLLLSVLFSNTNA